MSALPPERPSGRRRIGPRPPKVGPLPPYGDPTLTRADPSARPTDTRHDSSSGGWASPTGRHAARRSAAPRDEAPSGGWERPAAPHGAPPAPHGAPPSGGGALVPVGRPQGGALVPVRPQGPYVWQEPRRMGRVAAGLITLAVFLVLGLGAVGVVAWLGSGEEVGETAASVPEPVRSEPTPTPAPVVRLTLPERIGDYKIDKGNVAQREVKRIRAQYMSEDAESKAVFAKAKIGLYWNGDAMLVYVGTSAADAPGATHEEFGSSEAVDREFFGIVADTTEYPPGPDKGFLRCGHAKSEDGDPYDMCAWTGPGANGLVYEFDGRGMKPLAATALAFRASAEH